MANTSTFRVLLLWGLFISLFFSLSSVVAYAVAVYRQAADAVLFYLLLALGSSSSFKCLFALCLSVSAARRFIEKPAYGSAAALVFYLLVIALGAALGALSIFITVFAEGNV
ncbi:MAG: hypothetical protein FWG66_01735 [Spirochaetes bacterium]|nr:hypothetical protein [Spirochaetota bacterium]